MAPYLRTLTVQPPKADLLSQLEERNAAELKSLEDKLKDAEENLGESEVSELLRAKAMYLCRIGSKVGLRRFGWADGARSRRSPL